MSLDIATACTFVTAALKASRAAVFSASTESMGVAGLRMDESMMKWIGLDSKLEEGRKRDEALLSWKTPNGHEADTRLLCARSYVGNSHPLWPQTSFTRRSDVLTTLLKATTSPSTFQPPFILSNASSVEPALTRVLLAAEPVHPYTIPALQPSGSVLVHPNTLDHHPDRARNTTYGATRRPPPPYSQLQALWESGQPVGHDESLDVPPSETEPLQPKQRGCMDTKKFAVFLTFALTMTFCALTLPVTYCNDPADPKVRGEVHRKWSKEVIEHKREVANWKVRWELEDEQHTAQLCDWENERIEHKLELKEHAERKQDERKQYNMYWAGSKAHQCTTYAEAHLSDPSIIYGQA
ncbi:hypothetical protein PAXINDRAFT_20154 [Paxillus involutus ATCC 200175]|uniref:Unplaced genomic scaffold PAXINscaffold_903, whole genome shotgun sequence n=1 Tax=Paxillus involutus ATCC 200175 TaxID=664439 RepID=A0A0C9SMR8_PAXIN|nr:hypothetical protein PAXINDRAFT_20154 [Paxillus involutus ATCC 200175]